MRGIALACTLLIAARALAQAPPSAATATEQRLAAERACAAREPTCDWLRTFSSLERASVRRALAALGLEPDPAPWGKVIGRIRIHNEEVFAEDNWLQVLNLFHVTTRTSTIRSELTIAEGEPWDDDRVAETARRIKDPIFTTVVAVLPVKSSQPGTVDLLIVTRDVWSLRLNSKYAIQQGSLTDLTVSLSENNFLGRRMVLATAMVMDQGAISVGPLFIDKNLAGRHVDFRVRLERIYTRRSLDVLAIDGTRVPTGDPEGLQDGGVLRPEGSAAAVQLTRPLWSLASRWGWGAIGSYRNAITRSYYGTGLRAYDAPSTPDHDYLPRQFRLRTWGGKAHVVRQWGAAYKHQVEMGHSVSRTRPTLLAGFSADPALRADFTRDVFPRDELISQPYVEYAFVQARFRTVRNIDTYELAEDVRLGPNLTVGLAQALRLLGSDRDFTRPSLTLGWTFPWCADGFVRVSAGAQIRIQGRTTVDNTANAMVRASTPTYGLLRVVGEVSAQTRWNDTQNSFYTLGAENGLRAYRIGDFIGQRRLLAQLEVRSVPLPVWVLRFGAVAFYEGGGAADSFRRMPLYHDVGLGLRMLVPQTSRDLFRFDLAFPLVDAPGTRAGYPRFIAGFDSYF